MTTEIGKFIVNCVNSYDKNCGSRAIECAEEDLLGQLLNTCDRLVHELDDTATVLVNEGVSVPFSISKAIGYGQAIIAKTQGLTCTPISKEQN